MVGFDADKGTAWRRSRVAKLFRLWGKKRGSRLSGWWVVGSLSEASFYGLLFLLGIVSLTIVVTWHVFWPESDIYPVGFGFWLMVIASTSFVLIGLTGFLYRFPKFWPPRNFGP